MFRQPLLYDDTYAVVAPRMRDVATKEPHEALVFVLGALVLAHVGGAMLQQLKHGGTLRRMVPFLK